MYKTLICAVILLCITFTNTTFAQHKNTNTPIQLTSIEQGDAPQKSNISNVYKLAPDDVVSITVYGEQELSKNYKIDQNGYIAFPLIGDIYAKDISAAELKAELTKQLSDGYFINPSVTIEIAQHRSIYILGEVRAPGKYEFTPGMTILNAAAIAGGFTYRANQKKVDLLRVIDSNVKSEYQELPIQAKLEPGDIILIKERFF